MNDTSDTNSLSLRERVRRFWFPHAGSDHPLGQDEREATPPATVIGELADAAAEQLGGGEER